MHRREVDHSPYLLPSLRMLEGVLPVAIFVGHGAGNLYSAHNGC